MSPHSNLIDSYMMYRIRTNQYIPQPMYETTIDKYSTKYLMSTLNVKYAPQGSNYIMDGHYRCLQVHYCDGVVYWYHFILIVLLMSL